MTPRLFLKKPGRAAIAAAGVLLLLWLGARLTRAQSGNISMSLTARGATTLTIGSAFLWECKSTNVGTTSVTMNQNFYLIYPDGTKVKILPVNKSTTVAPGGNKDSKPNTTSTVFSSETGTFMIECDAVNSSGTVLATASLPYTILPLPAGIIPPHFTNAASAAGVATVVHKDRTDCQQFFGSGAGWADYNGDGLLDLFVTDYNGPSHLFKNNGNGTFTDVTATAFPNNNPLTLTRATGVSWADYDNDGNPDLLVMTYGYPRLFHNNGDGTFSDVSVAAGLSTLNGRGSIGAWGDFDGDGYIDLYTSFYGNLCGASSVQYASHLFHNNGNGTFTDVTSYLGGTSNAALMGKGWSATWFDFNNDNRPDLYIANDVGGSTTSHPNVLFRNDGSNGQGGWIFTDVSASSGANAAISAMGIGIGDFNRDGNMDIIVSNINNNFLYANNGNGTFTESGANDGFQRAQVDIGGVGASSITWGLQFGDFNNDGYEDAFMNGGVIGGTGNVMPKAVLVNNLNSHLTGVTGDGVFLDLTYASGATNLDISRTLALGDYDGDGWLDAFVGNISNETAELYHNDSAAQGNTNSWLEVRLVGAGSAPLGSLPHGSNRMGIGAKLTVTAGSDTQYRQIISGTSLYAGTQAAAHFGMAQHSQADTLTILWPSGLTQTFTSVPVNQRLVVTEGSSVLGID